MKKIIVGLVIAALTLSFLSGCAEQDPEYAAVCVDPTTEERLPDDYCDKDDPNYLAMAVMWYMLMDSSRPYPAVGSKVNKSYFTTKLPAGKKYTTGLSSKGGTSVKSWSTKTYNSGSGSSSTNRSTTKPGGSFGTSSRTTTRR